MHTVQLPQSSAIVGDSPIPVTGNASGSVSPMVSDRSTTFAASQRKGVKIQLPEEKRSGALPGDNNETAIPDENECNQAVIEEQEVSETRVYAERHLMLAMFVLLSASNALQWIEYSIIAHIISQYYTVSFATVDWTSMIYMLMYMILIFPGSWFLDRYGLRVSLLIGGMGNCLGAWLKILSIAPDRFWLTFVAQTIVGSSQVFILGIPPRLAAVWYGPEQVSTACAIGVFGNQLGIAIGFVLPPWLVHTGSTESISHDLFWLFMISAVTNTFIIVCIALFFSERPPLPPSQAQARAIEQCVDQEFLKSLKKLICNPNYVILLISYGINVGVFYAVSTLLSQMILAFYPDAQESTGTIGLSIVVSGMVGSVVCGYVLDKFHHYKATTLLVYLFTFIGMVIFTFTIGKVPLWLIYVVSSLLGFFMTGYLPLGFEFAAELTFPIAEGTASGFLNGAVQVFGIAMTIGMGKVIYSLSIFWANVMMSSLILVGLFLTALINADLRRQNAHEDVQYTRSEPQVSNSAD